jgi:hypothetical protein
LRAFAGFTVQHRLASLAPRIKINHFRGLLELHRQVFERSASTIVQKLDTIRRSRQAPRILLERTWLCGNP